MAPEQQRSSGEYDHTVDIWAYGCILECMCTHRQVYCKWTNAGMALNELTSKIWNHRIQPEAPEGHFMETLVTSCAACDPEDRLPFSGVVAYLDCMHGQAEEEDAAASQPAGVRPSRASGAEASAAAAGTTEELQQPIPSSSALPEPAPGGVRPSAVAEPGASA